MKNSDTVEMLESPFIPNVDTLSKVLTGEPSSVARNRIELKTSKVASQIGYTLTECDKATQKIKFFPLLIKLKDAHTTATLLRF